MKLCFIGSTSLHVLRWIKYFVDKGYEVSLITFSDVEKLPFEGVKLIKLEPYDFLNPKNIIRVYQLTKKLKNIIKEIKPDLIHAHQISSLAYLLPFVNFHPYVLSAWGTDILLRPDMKKIYSLLASRTIKKADLLHCDGIKTWEAFESIGALPNNIVKIYFGTNTKIYNPKKRSIEFRKKIGVNLAPVVISTRQLSPIYNIETLVRAIPIVIKEIPNTQFIIGSSGNLKKELEELVEKLNVKSSTIFTGRISDEEFPNYVASADIYVSTSLSDAGLSSSTAEAMSCGLPVIVTEDPDNRYWIEDGVNGFIIPVKSPNILAERIIKLINNKKLRKEMGEKNRKIIEEKNNYYVEMGKMEKEYEKLINKYSAVKKDAGEIIR